MKATPRYTKHLFYGQDFERFINLFYRAINIDPQFKKHQHFAEQGLFSLAIRRLIIDYLHKTGMPLLLAEEKAQKEKENKLQESS